VTSVDDVRSSDGDDYSTGVEAGRCLWLNNELKQGCPTKLVSFRYNRNWHQNYFPHFSKQNVCFGCFALI
jgi:hypothetical protein